MKYFFPILLLIISSHLCGQNFKEDKELMSKIDSLYFDKTPSYGSSRMGVSFQNKIQEQWTFFEGDNCTEYLINYYRDSTIYTEMFFEHDGRLLFASLSQDYCPPNSFDQIYWSCNFYIRDDSVATFISLGHGPTEDPNWDENSIIGVYKKRKTEFDKMKK